jgi:methylmalonyl-CoA/ethylmalonyl-CoA epimerase
VKIDHIGIAVQNLDETISFYEDVLGLEKTAVETVEGQGVRVAFFNIGESKFELLEPLTDESPIARHIKKRGEGIQHIAINVDGLESKVAEMRKKGIRFIGEISSGAEGKKIIFVHPVSTSGLLLELCEGEKNEPGR